MLEKCERLLYKIETPFPFAVMKAMNTKNLKYRESDRKLMKNWSEESYGEVEIYKPIY